MKRTKKCKWFGHHWVPVFCKGAFNEIEVKFITCYCARCGKGHAEMIDMQESMTNREYNTYSEKYFDK